MTNINEVINSHDRRLRNLETKTSTTSSTSGGLPAGGSTGDMLVKSSSASYDVTWATGIPTGGTTGQVLAKASGTNYDMEWVSTGSSAQSPAFVAYSSASSSSTNTSLSIDMPSGVSTGDLVVIFCAGENSTAPSMTSSGWTTYYSVTGATEPTIGRTIFYKFMGATPDTSATMTISSLNATAAIAYAFSGVQTPSGMSHPIKNFLYATDTVNMPNAPAVYTSYDNELVFIMGALDDDPVGIVGTPTVPSGFTNFSYKDGGNATSGSNITVMAATKPDASKGSVDAAVFGGTGSDNWIAFSMTFWNVSSVTKKEIMVAASDETTALTTGTAKVTFRAPEDMYLMSSNLPRASLTTAATGAAFVLDVKDDGTSIFRSGSTLTLDVSEKTSTTAASPCVLSSSYIADDSEITVDISTIGSTVAGAGLKVTLYYYVL